MRFFGEHCDRSAAYFPSIESESKIQPFRPFRPDTARSHECRGDAEGPVDNVVGVFIVNMPDHKERFNLRRIKTLIGVSRTGSPGRQWKTKNRKKQNKTIRNVTNGRNRCARPRSTYLSGPTKSLLKFQINLGKTSCKSVDDIIPRLQSLPRWEPKRFFWVLQFFVVENIKKKKQQQYLPCCSQIGASVNFTRNGGRVRFALVLEYLYLYVWFWRKRLYLYSMLVFMRCLICPVWRRRRYGWDGKHWGFVVSKWDCGGNKFHC